MSVTVANKCSTNAFSPVDFDRAQRRADVEELVGEPGVPLPRSDGMFDGLDPYAYEVARLIVGYLNGWVYLVQTY